MSDTFKVRVFKAGSKAYWYADKIGEEFSVTVDSDIDFLTITAGSKNGRLHRQIRLRNRGG